MIWLRHLIEKVFGKSEPQILADDYFFPNDACERAILEVLCYILKQDGSDDYCPLNFEKWKYTERVEVASDLVSLVFMDSGKYSELIKKIFENAGVGCYTGPVRSYRSSSIYPVVDPTGMFSTRRYCSSIFVGFASTLYRLMKVAHVITVVQFDTKYGYSLTNVFVVPIEDNQQLNMVKEFLSTGISGLAVSKLSDVDCKMYSSGYDMLETLLGISGYDCSDLLGYDPEPVLQRSCVYEKWCYTLGAHNFRVLYSIYVDENGNASWIIEKT